MNCKSKHEIVLTNIKKYSLINRFIAFLALLLLLGTFSRLSAVYPPTPTEFYGNAGFIYVVTDENGHAMAAYKDEWDIDTIITYYYSGGVWVLIPIDNATDIQSLTGLVMSPAGQALLTYTVPIDNNPNPFTYDIHSRSFDGVSWTTPVTDPIAALVNDPGTLSMNVTGYTVTSWSDGSDNIITRVFANGDWETPSNPSDIGIGTNSQVAVNNDGTIVVAWETLSGSVEVSQYIGGVWSPPTTINPSAFLRSVGIASNGNSLVLVRQAVENLPALASDLFASYFIGDTLDSTTLINPPQTSGSPDNFNASLQMSENGTAVAVWFYDYTNQLYYAQFNGSTWASAVEFQVGPQITDVGLSVNGNGDAILFWGNQSDPEDTMDYLTAVLPVGGSLSTPQVVATSDRNSSGVTAVSLADNGFNALAWLDGGGEGLVPFGLAAIPGPAVTNLTAFACNDRLSSQQDCIKTVTWDPSTDPNISHYDFYKNGVYITFYDFNDPLIYEENAPCFETTVYEIIPFDILNYEGLPASYTLEPCGCRG